jgi:hypothetical protein
MQLSKKTEISPDKIRKCKTGGFCSNRGVTEERSVKEEE